MLNSETTPHTLSMLLGTSYSNLCHTLYGNDIKFGYRKFIIRKKNGGERLISSPNQKVSVMQRRLKQHLDDIYKPHHAATAFIKKTSIVENAKRHTRKAVVFNIDLKDFYSSINFGRVRGLLIAKPYELNAEVARLIAHLCCLEGSLPQGAPTSPIVSNMISRKLDRDLSILAKESRAQYTRYADDITFSFREDSENDIYKRNQHGEVEIHKKLKKIIEKNGFKINKEKTRLQTYRERQVVTGLKVNNKVNIDRRYIRTTRAMIHSISVDLDIARRRFHKSKGNTNTSLDAHLAGRLNFISMIKGLDSKVYLNLAERFNALGLDYSVPVTPKEYKAGAEKNIEFNRFKYNTILQRNVFVLDFEGVDNLNENGELIEGTAFALSDGRILTTTHTFVKAGSPTECNIKPIDKPGTSYRAMIASSCIESDITILKLKDNNIRFKGLSIAKNLEIKSGYKLALTGFPQRLLGSKTVTVKNCTVINEGAINTFDHLELSTDIDAGNSGGPLVNAYCHVVGMAKQGRMVSFDENEALIEGNNVCISAKHFQKK